jgi:hypothetical protein
VLGAHALYFNLKTMENHEIPNHKLSESFIRMQKLAGLITEQEYTSLYKEIDLMNLSNSISEKCKLIKQSIKDQGYDI